MILALMCQRSGIHLVIRGCVLTSFLRFYLWTRSNSGDGDYQELLFNDASSILGSNFDPSKKTKYLMHGYNDGGTATWVRLVKNSYLQVGMYKKVCL